MRVFDENICFLLNIFNFKNDDYFILNEDVKNKEADLFNKLNAFEASISDIINDNLKIEEAENIIKSIEELIDIEAKELKLSYSQFSELNIDIDTKTNRIYLILDFLQKQKDKIENARKNIYKEYENNLDILIGQINEYKDYLKDFISDDVIYLKNGQK